MIYCITSVKLKPVFVSSTFAQSQLYEVLLMGLTDPSAKVKTATRDVLLPVFAAWAAQIGQLHLHLLPAFTDQLRSALRTNDEALMVETFSDNALRLSACLPFLFVRSCVEFSRQTGEEGSDCEGYRQHVESDQGEMGMIVGRDPILRKSVQCFRKAACEKRFDVISRSCDLLGWTFQSL
jgi:hypothetical protein